MYTSQRNQIKLTLYNEFYSKHKKLFKKDKQLYWHECARYVDHNFSMKEAEYFAKELKNYNKKHKETFGYIGRLSQSYRRQKNDYADNTSLIKTRVGYSEKPTVSYSGLEKTKKKKTKKATSKKETKKTTTKTQKTANSKKVTKKETNNVTMSSMKNVMKKATKKVMRKKNSSKSIDDYV